MINYLTSFLCTATTIRTTISTMDRKSDSKSNLNESTLPLLDEEVNKEKIELQEQTDKSTEATETSAESAKADEAAEAAKKKKEEEKERKRQQKIEEEEKKKQQKLEKQKKKEEGKLVHDLPLSPLSGRSGQWGAFEWPSLPVPRRDYLSRNGRPLFVLSSILVIVR